MTTVKKLRPFLFAAIFILPAMRLAVPQTGNQQNGGVAPQDSDYQKAEPSDYLGSDTCKGCHEELGKALALSAHGKARLTEHSGPQWQGCEACHGPGREHAEAGDPDKIIRFPGLSREASSRRCLGCHDFKAEHANFLQSAHFKNNVGCLDCHSVHQAKVPGKLLKAAQPQLCLSCHAAIQTDSRRVHHPANQVPVECTNCHNPHGGAPVGTDSRTEQKLSTDNRPD